MITTNYDDWNNFRKIVSEYNKFAIENNHPTIKVISRAQATRDIKSVFDELFKDVDQVDFYDVAKQDAFPVEICKIYKGIRNNDSYFVVKRSVCTRLFDLTDPGVFCVYVILKYHARDQNSSANKLGETFVSAEKIAKIAGKSVRWVMEKLSKLRKAGIIENNFQPGDRKPTRIVT